MRRNIIGIVAGSRKDLDHVRDVAAQLKNRGWTYSIWDSEVYSQATGGQVYTVFPGSVHRDAHETLNYVSRLSNVVRNNGNRLVYLTCIGLRDEGSGCIAGQTGRRVVAVPPDVKEYGRYPNGVRVYPFSKEMQRENDIVAALGWIQQEFESPNWDAEDIKHGDIRTKARAELLSFREDVLAGKMKF